MSATHCQKKAADPLGEPHASRGRSTPEPVTVLDGVVVANPVKPTQLVHKRTEGQSISQPFSRDSIGQHVDLSNCTWGRLGWDSVASLAIRRWSLWSEDSPFKWESMSGFNVISRERVFPGWPDAESDSDSDCGGRYGGRRRCRSRSPRRKSEKAAEEEGDERVHTTLTLGMGVHKTTFKERPVHVLLQRNGGSNEFEYNSCSGGWMENKEIFVFVDGIGEQEFMQEFLEEMIKLIPMKIPEKPKPREFSIYRWDHCNNYWRKRQTQQARQMESVILPEGLTDKVEADMREFLSPETATWYKRFGIPYKRSYLFHGVPGSGKTSTICALAGLLNRNVCFLAAHHPSFSDDSMKSAMERLPKRSFLIMEDIDSLFIKRQSQSRNSSLTFTGLLNCLDGIGHAQGQIVVMTTNYVNRLDEALIRAGRADMWVEFKKASDFQLAGLFKWFYIDTPEDAEKWAPVFVEGVRKKFTRGITMCEMQQHFVDHRKSNAEACAKGVEKYDMPLRKFKHLKSLDFESDDSEEESSESSSQRRRRRKKKSYRDENTEETRILSPHARPRERPGPFCN